jgi:ABC-type bacteriocin/lantibiotic exporter with double-glycine peptidase domain
MKNEVYLTPLSRFWKYIKEEKKEIYAIYFYAVINGLVSLSLPLGIQAIFNFILGGRFSTSWILLVIVVAFGIIFGGFLQISQLYLTEKLQQRIFTNVGFGFAFRLPKLRMDDLINKYTPELVNRFFDAVNLQKGMSKILMEFSTATIQVIFGLLLLSFYHPFFILFGAILILILFFIFYYTSPRGMETALKESSAKYDVAYWLEEVARTMSTFKLAGTADLPFLKVDRLLQTYVNYRNKHFSVLVLQYKFLIAFKVLIVTSLLIVGSILLLNNEISLGQFVAAEVIIILVVNSVEKLILSLETVYDTLTGFEKIGLVMDMPEERTFGTEKAFSPEDSGVRFDIKNLSYKPKEDWPNLLDDVSFSVNQGEKVLLKGNSGSGKTVLLNLLAGLYMNYKGKIIVNGLPLDTMNLSKFRGVVGVNFSYEDIFHGTIRENITLGRDIDENYLREIISMVGLKDYIYKLPDDLDSMLNPGGKGLGKVIISAIILARCFITKPKAILLEDFFDALKDDIKEKVMEFILSQPWTVILITDYDKIQNKIPRVIAMEKGGIVYDGPQSEFKGLN